MERQVSVQVVPYDGAIPSNSVQIVLKVGPDSGTDAQALAREIQDMMGVEDAPAEEVTQAIPAATPVGETSDAALAAAAEDAKEHHP